MNVIYQGELPVPNRKTVIVTGGSQGIGFALVKTFLKRDYNVVATSRNISNSKELPTSPQLTLVDDGAHVGRW